MTEGRARAPGRSGGPWQHVRPDSSPVVHERINPVELVPVILSGGSGTRLWPLSREAHPKQFLPLVGERSLLQETWLRLRGLPGAEAPLVVANEEHRFMVAEQLRQVGVDAVGADPRAGRPQHRAGDRRRRAAGARPTAPIRCCWCCRPTT